MTAFSLPADFTLTIGARLGRTVAAAKQFHMSLSPMRLIADVARDEYNIGVRVSSFGE
jgi:hypothetical protein